MLEPLHLTDALKGYTYDQDKLLTPTETIRRVRPITRVLVAATSGSKAQEFAKWVVETTGLSAERGAPEEVSAADVIAACTTSPTPVVVDEAVRPGAHVNAVGAFTPSTRELPSALVLRAGVYVDTRAGALSEGGDLILAGVQQVRGELGEVLLGTAPGRQSADEVTVYKSVGAAFLDAATARLAYDAAAKQGVGTVYEFSTE